MRRPCCETGKQCNDQVDEAYRSKAVDELVFEVDIEWDACVHIARLSAIAAKWHPGC